MRSRGAAGPARPEGGQVRVKVEVELDHRPGARATSPGEGRPRHRGEKGGACGAKLVVGTRGQVLGGLARALSVG